MKKRGARCWQALAAATRDTDILGWSKHQKVIGVMFIELGTALDSGLMATMLLRVSDVLREILALEQFRRVDISFQRFPSRSMNCPCHNSCRSCSPWRDGVKSHFSDHQIEWRPGGKGIVCC